MSRPITSSNDIKHLISQDVFTSLTLQDIHDIASWLRVKDPQNNFPNNCETAQLIILIKRCNYTRNAQDADRLTACADLVTAWLENPQNQTSVDYFADNLLNPILLNPSSGAQIANIVMAFVKKEHADNTFDKNAQFFLSYETLASRPDFIEHFTVALIRENPQLLDINCLNQIFRHIRDPQSCIFFLDLVLQNLDNKAAIDLLYGLSIFNSELSAPFDRKTTSILSVTLANLFSQNRFTAPELITFCLHLQCRKTAKDDMPRILAYLATQSQENPRRIINIANPEIIKILLDNLSDREFKEFTFHLEKEARIDVQIKAQSLKSPTQKPYLALGELNELMRLDPNLVKIEEISEYLERKFNTETRRSPRLADYSFDNTNFALQEHPFFLQRHRLRQLLEEVLRVNSEDVISQMSIAIRSTNPRTGVAVNISELFYLLSNATADPIRPAFELKEEDKRQLLYFFAKNRTQIDSLLCSQDGLKKFAQSLSAELYSTTPQPLEKAANLALAKASLPDVCDQILFGYFTNKIFPDIIREIDDDGFYLTTGHFGHNEINNHLIYTQNFVAGMTDYFKREFTSGAYSASLALSQIIGAQYLQSIRQKLDLDQPQENYDAQKNYLAKLATYLVIKKCLPNLLKDARLAEFKKDCEFQLIMIEDPVLRISQREDSRPTPTPQRRDEQAIQARQILNRAANRWGCEIS